MFENILFFCHNLLVSIFWFVEISFQNHFSQINVVFYQEFCRWTHFFENKLKKHRLPQNHQLTTLLLTVGPSIKVYELMLKINYPMEKMNGNFTSGIQLLHTNSEFTLYCSYNTHTSQTFCFPYFCTWCKYARTNAVSLHSTFPQNVTRQLKI